MFWILACVAVALSIGLGHFVAGRLTKDRKIKAGRGREVMPSVVNWGEERGTSAQRWRRSVDRVEERILARFDGDAFGLRAGALARELGEAEELVEAALEQMREEISCRVRVTRSGELLHDFRGDDLQTLREKREARAPFRLFLTALSAMANVSAVWPVLMVLFVAIATLDLLIWLPAEESLRIGLIGFIVVGAVVAFAWAGSVFVNLLLAPTKNRVKLSYAHEKGTRRELKAELKRLRKERGEGFFSFRRSPYVVVASVPLTMATTTGVRKRGSKLSRREDEGWFSGGRSEGGGSRSRGGGSGGGGGGGGGGGAAAGAAGLIRIIAIVFFVMIVLACLFTLFVWIRGLYRAVKNRNLEVENFGPAAWTRLVDDADWYERFLPTNDLISRLSRSVQRTLRRRRPVDLQMAGRLMRAARERGEPLSTLSIALDEAVDMQEAAEIGSRLCHRFGGEILVAPTGDLLFDIDSKSLKDLSLFDGPDYEYLARKKDGSFGRDRDQPLGDRLPVNLTGLKYVHVNASNFLVGGALSMFLTALYLFIFLSPAELKGAALAMPETLGAVLWALGPVIVFLTFLFATGTVCLVTTARYLAKDAVVEGVQRDARRALAHTLRTTVYKAGTPNVDLERVIARLYSIFQKNDRRFTVEFFRKECEGLLIDLELDAVAEFDRFGAMRPISVEKLRARHEALLSMALEDLEDDVVAREERDSAQAGDEIVFDSHREPLRQTLREPEQKPAPEPAATV